MTRHTWKGERCDLCGTHRDWPLARRSCPVRDVGLAGVKPRERQRLPQDARAQILQLYRAGLSYAQISSRVAVPRQHVRSAVLSCRGLQLWLPLGSLEATREPNRGRRPKRAKKGGLNVAPLFAFGD